MSRSDSYRIETGNCISCLLWFGSDEVGIQKIRRGGYFFKRSKGSGVAVIRRGGPAAEAKPTNLKERMNLKYRLRVFFEKTIY